MDSAPPTSFADVQTIIREEFGKDLEELFSEFDPVPLGSASLGQAHRAVLRATGEVVAVKVQHKDVRRRSPGDIRLFGLVLRGAEALFPDFKYAWLAEEFRELLPPELNFRKEAENCERCAEIFKDNPSIVVPSIYHDYTTERVLTMSYEEGVSMTQLDEENTFGIDYQRCAELISEAFSYMIFDRGFLHCDPHAGNIIVRQTGDDLKVVLLDHGLYTELKDETRLSYTKLWRGILTQNEEQIKEASREIVGERYY